MLTDSHLILIYRTEPKREKQDQNAGNSRVAPSLSAEIRSY